MVQTIIRAPELKKSTGLSKETIYRLIRKGEFPKQIKLGGGRAVGWLESDIAAWQQKQIGGEA